MPDILIAADKKRYLDEVITLLSDEAGISCEICGNEELLKQAMIGRYDFVVSYNNNAAQAMRHFGFIKKNLQPLTCTITWFTDTAHIKNICCDITTSDSNYLFQWSDKAEVIASNILNAYCEHKNKSACEDNQRGVDCLYDWEVTFDIHHTNIDKQEYMDDLIHFLSQYRNIKPHIKVLRTIFAELVNNAIEHGLLGLDSEAKRANFDQYYHTKETAIEGLESGMVAINIKHVARKDNPELHIKVSDTGKGFDHESIVLRQQSSELLPFGRGISLVTALSRSIKYSGSGNTVEVIYSL